MARAYIKEENLKSAKVENLFKDPKSHSWLSWWKKQNLFIKIMVVIIGIWLAGFLIGILYASWPLLILGLIFWLVLKSKKRK